MCVPYLSTVLAAAALVASHDDHACEQHLPGIADGSTRAAFALLEGTGTLAFDQLELAVAPADDGGCVLTGEKRYVIDGHTADVLVVVAREREGLSLFAVERAAPGVHSTPVPTLDLTRRQAHVSFSEAPASRVGACGGAEPAIEQVLQLAAVALSLELVGCASACLEMSVQYAKDRFQFGRPIGSFQAIKHKCADMFRLMAQARAAAYEAAVTLAADAPQSRFVTSVAKVYASEAASWIAAENIQVHGGIGYTWEHPAHLYLRRAKSNEQLFGGPLHHREVVLRSLGL
jgi:alkylation response protein AidB-like acyl-CoA dehydrogenase